MGYIDYIEAALQTFGFEVVKGHDRGEEYRARWFKRQEGKVEEYVLTIRRLQQDGDEDVEESEKREIESEMLSQILRRFPHFLSDRKVGDLESFRERAYVIRRLQSKYPDEIVNLIDTSGLEIPQWLVNEVALKRSQGLFKQGGE